MRNKTVFAIVTGFTIAVLAGNALACGESLFRVGKGVSFRQYTAPLPGTILAVARTEAELEMVEQLVAAGHDIHVVADPSLIGVELARQEHQFDIVLAYYDQRHVVETQTAAAAVTYLPVTVGGAAEAEEAQARYGRSLSSDDSVKTFLKTIHRTLKARG